MPTETLSNGDEGKHDGPVHYMGGSGDATSRGGDTDKPELQLLNGSVVMETRSVVMETRVDTSVPCDVTNVSMVSPTSSGDAASVDLTHDVSDDDQEESLPTEPCASMATGGDVTDVTLATVTEREGEDIGAGSERRNAADGVGEGMRAEIHEAASLSDDQVKLSLFFPLSGVRCSRNILTASSNSLFHPHLSLVFFFQSSSSPAFLISLFTQSSHLSLGLHRLLLPSSRNSAALSGSLSSAILSTCPAHCSLLLTSLSVKHLCTPISSILQFTIFSSLARFSPPIVLFSGTSSSYFTHIFFPHYLSTGTTSTSFPPLSWKFLPLLSSLL